jgi:hypothetical protein
LKVSAVPAAIEQLAPASVIVTTCPLPAAEPTVHVPKPVVSATVGDAGTVKPAGNVTLMKSPAFSAPLVFGGPATVALVVRPIVHVERAPAVCGDPLALRPVTGVAAAIVTLAAGARAVVSPDVFTDQCAVVIAPAAGFVMFAIVTLTCPELVTAQVPPLLPSVMTTV